ncbi:MAG: DUF1566 domain-containing protein [Bacteroidaceae bacterium]|nr:DUF1566 domain-containing protein [Bacteroidaceae bacterium]
MNVGASSPEDYGDYFAWGETKPKDTYTWSNYTWCDGSSDTQTKYCTSDNKTVLELEDDAARANWGGNWRMPTIDEMIELVENCTREWTTRNEVIGCKVTGPNGHFIFLPAAGNRLDDSLDGAGFGGYYWSSSVYTDDGIYAFGLNFRSGTVRWGYYYGRYRGHSVRAVCP